MGRARGRHIQYLVKPLYSRFRVQPHHSSQQDWLGGPSPWVLQAPETIKNPVKPFYFVSEASHIILASKIGWIG